VKRRPVPRSRWNDHRGQGFSPAIPAASCLADRVDALRLLRAHGTPRSSFRINPASRRGIIRRCGRRASTVESHAGCARERCGRRRLVRCAHAEEGCACRKPGPVCAASAAEHDLDIAAGRSSATRQRRCARHARRARNSGAGPLSVQVPSRTCARRRCSKRPPGSSAWLSDRRAARDRTARRMAGRRVVVIGGDDR